MFQAPDPAPIVIPAPAPPPEGSIATAGDLRVAAALTEAEVEVNSSFSGASIATRTMFAPVASSPLSSSEARALVRARPPVMVAMFQNPRTATPY